MFLKKTISLLVLAALLGQVFNRAVLVTSYYVNAAAYAKNCENKARPKLNCNGRCQMMKKMRQEEKQEKQNTERRSFQDETLSSRSFYASLHNTASTPPVQHRSLYRASFPKGILPLVFHPPGAGC